MRAVTIEKIDLLSESRRLPARDSVQQIVEAVRTSFPAARRDATEELPQRSAAVDSGAMRSLTDGRHTRHAAARPT